MVQVEKRELPTCGTACCGGVVPGSFRNSSNAPNVHDYVADQNEGCSYFSYRRAEVPTSISALVLVCFECPLWIPAACQRVCVLQWR